MKEILHSVQDDDVCEIEGSMRGVRYKIYTKNKEEYMNERLLLFCPQMGDLAKRVVNNSSLRIHLGAIEWKEFSDSFPDIFIRNVEFLRHCDVTFLASFDTPYEVFRQLAVIYALPRYGAKSLRVILPYFPTGTMERVQKEGTIATAMTLARQLTATPLTASGPVEFVMVDIHALQERFYFGDTIVPRLVTAIPLLKERIRGMKDIAVAFPDEGAYKRFGEMFDEYPQIFCHKLRRGSERKVTIIEGDPAGKNVIIVDDIIFTGGTQIVCRNTLYKQGAQCVSAYATHGEFPNDSWKNFLGKFRYVWITDSCPRIAKELRGINPPFELLTLQPIVSQIILNP